jgi:hypothetical protein
VLGKLAGTIQSPKQINGLRNQNENKIRFNQIRLESSCSPNTLFFVFLCLVIFLRNTCIVLSPSLPWCLLLLQRKGPNSPKRGTTEEDKHLHAPISIKLAQVSLATWNLSRWFHQALLAGMALENLQDWPS